MENTLYYVKMSNEIYGPYSNEEMENFDIPGDTPVSTDPDGDWSTYSQSDAPRYGNRNTCQTPDVIYL